MTATEDGDGDRACDSRLAAFLAVHMVKQILDDAYVIANSAIESGQPWRYQSIDKTVTPHETDDEEVPAKLEDDVVEDDNKVQAVINEVATSTPHKATGEGKKSKGDASLIGQGDEDLELHQIELTNTSMFINHLFDMSDVEKVVCDENENLQSEAEPNILLTEAMAKIMDSYVNAALGIASEQPTNAVDSGVPADGSSSAGHSEYSFLSDAFVTDFDKDIAFYIQDTEDTIECEVTHIVPEVKIKEVIDESTEGSNAQVEVARFENAYLSLNRDYEQGIEDDGNIILDDPKGMTLQEVELMTANTSSEDLSPRDNVEPESKCENSKELNATSAVSAVSKKSIVSRCKSQGARLLACLRGWWRRRTPGYRKEHQHRVAGAVRGLCPLSPDARRRAASLIDHRLLRSPSPSRAGAWKFNTVNETVVNSSRWKDYTFDTNPDEKGEY